MKRPQITQEIIDRNYPEVEVLTDAQDGEGIPYFDQPEGVYQPIETEDDVEMLRR